MAPKCAKMDKDEHKSEKKASSDVRSGQKWTKKGHKGPKWAKKVHHRSVLDDLPAKKGVINLYGMTSR